MSTCVCGHSLQAHQGHTIPKGAPDVSHCSQGDDCHAFRAAPEDLRAVAEGLAGSHGFLHAIGEPLIQCAPIVGWCQCGQQKRVSAILARLQEDEEKALDRDRELETVREEYRRFTTLAEDDSWVFDVPPEDKACVAEFRIRWLRERGMREAAEAKVASLEKERDSLRFVHGQTFVSAMAVARAEGKREGVEGCIAIVKESDDYDPWMVGDMQALLLPTEAGEREKGR